MKKSRHTAIFETRIEGDVAYASFTAVRNGHHLCTKCAIHIPSGEVQIATPPVLPGMSGVNSDSISGSGAKLIQDHLSALSAPDNEFVDVNGYELDLAKDPLREKAGIRRVESLELLNIALGLSKLN